MNYFINAAAVDIAIPPFEVDPASCPEEFTITVAQADGSPLPAGITFDPIANSIQVFSSDYSEHGTYTIVVTAQDPKTLVLNQELVFSVDFRCAEAILLVGAMADYNY